METDRRRKRVMVGNEGRTCRERVKEEEKKVAGLACFASEERAARGRGT